MFVDDFNFTAAAAALACARCNHKGLMEADAEAFDAAALQDRHRSNVITCPSFTVRCPVCGLVGEDTDMGNG